MKGKDVLSTVSKAIIKDAQDTLVEAMAGGLHGVRV